MTTKICNKCNTEKSISEFGKHSSQKDGLRNTCKQCNNSLSRQYTQNIKKGNVLKISKEKKVCPKCGEEKKANDFFVNNCSKDGLSNYCILCSRKATQKYHKSKKGVISVIYLKQLENSKKRNMKPPTYSKDELSVWLYKNGFENFYTNWVNSDYNTLLKPSIDRINDLFGYSFDNIRLTTWAENNKNAHRDRLMGINASGKVCRKVVQLNKDFIKIKEYVSVSSASRGAGYSIQNALKTGRKGKNGYFWRYKEA